MLKVEGIKKSFAKKEVLNGVDISLERGVIYGLIGKNGAGKTTLMNIISGLSDADAGNLVILKESGEKANVGFLPDVPMFFDYMNTREYICFLLKDKKEGCEKASELLSSVGLPENVRISTMSRGMRQRLGIAAVMVNDPDILLLDEPTSALDPSGRQELFDILLGLRDKGKTIVLSTHILTDMEHICDKVGFLHEGIIKHEMELKEEHKDNIIIDITYEHKINEVVLKENNINAFNIDDYTVRINMGENIEEQKRLFMCLSNIDNPVKDIKNFRQSLDDIFKEVCL